MPIDLSEYESTIIVRPIRIEDFDAIVELQLLAFPGMRPWTREQVESQLATFPEGQICIEIDGAVVASSSSLIVDFDLYEEKHSWMDVSDYGMIRNHDPAGDTLYGIEIMVHPEYRGQRLARRLYDARKDLVRQKNLKRVVIGGRIPGYAERGQEMSATTYVEKVMSKLRQMGLVQ